MKELGTLLTIGLGILALATAAGFGLQRGTVQRLREQLKDSDDEMVRKDRRLGAAETELVQVRTELAALARVVTGEAHWIAIGQKLDEHHEQAETHWTRDEQLLAEIRDRLPEKRST